MSITEIITRLSNLQLSTSNNSLNNSFLATQTWHIFSNECNASNRWRYLSYYLPTPSREKINTALLLGESSFISIAPELHQNNIQLVILADIVPQVLAHHNFLIQCMKKSNTRKAFLENYEVLPNPVSEKFVIEEILTQLWNSTCQFEGDDSLPSLHFLESEARFQLCKTAVQALHFVTLPLDFLDSDKIHLLKKNLPECSLQLINVTNLYDYQGNYALRNSTFIPEPWVDSGILHHNMEILCEGSAPVIMYSKMADIILNEKQISGLEACFTVSLAEYKKECQAYAAEWNAKKVVTQAIDCLRRKTGLNFFGVRSEASQFDHPIINAVAEADPKKMNTIAFAAQKLNAFFKTVNDKPYLIIEDINSTEKGRKIHAL